MPSERAAGTGVARTQERAPASGGGYRGTSLIRNSPPL